ncbi:hypothetical protein Pcinc_021639 [Petrolisthes cinctipes]|uniref:Protein unc-79 homolog n=1 Tax=Petrolisthes cinctipes TaxID=88211 RepID=A0AAE1KI21_PETCI|nr:hypothetical protein Pcinc_021639 [Petrolisthes cinctipes]
MPTAYHCQLLECLMSLKADIVKDLLCVIAYGTPSARLPAANLLFYYWPGLNPTLFDRRGIHIKFSGWKAMPCQIEECDGEGGNEAAKVCMDHAVCLGASPDNPPPLYLCLYCVDDIRREHSTVEFFDILMPMAQVSATCENKNCRSTEKNAMATCFSLECASYNSNRPIRYCSQCNNIRHNNRRGTDHIVHTNISSPWTMEPQMQHFTIEAIVSLLNEAQPFGDKTKCKDQERLNRAGLLDDIDKGDGLTPEEARMLSRYGVWLIISLCAPTEDTPIEMLGRILAALCHWFNATQYLPDDQQGTSIERLKSENIHNWLQDVCKTHFEVFVSCLMPHPIEYARVGGHWDTLATRTDHIKEGFNRLFCLVPYEVVTPQLWNRVMPHWMEAIHNDIPEEELVDLKITLSKLLDSDMSPLGFDAVTMYQFISVRFSNTSASVQEQTLSWLQILSSLNIVIPMTLLLSIFSDGASSLRNPPPPPTRKTSTSSRTHDAPVLEPVVEDDSGSSSGGLSEGEHPPSDHPEDHYSNHQLHLTCFVLMQDVLFKQMEVQEVERHQGVCGTESKVVLGLIRDMLAAPCLAPHTCSGQLECITCELTTTFFQLAADLTSYLCPRHAIQNNRVADIIPPEVESSQTNKSPEHSTQDGQTPASSTQSPKPVPPPPPKEGGGKVLSMMASMPQIVTATVETVGELDVAANMPQEHVVKAVATAVTLTEEDVAHATASVASASVVGEDDQPIDPTTGIDGQEDDGGQDGLFWVTSQGKFKFRLQDLPPHFQLVHTLLSMLEVLEDGDVVYHVCECLKYLVLHGEALAMAASEHRGFLIWCQENMSISTMWSLLEAEWSHVAEVCVQLLLHFITLPCGADIFWKLCETHFNHQDWKVRFQGVEKVVILGRFLGVWSVHQCPGLQAALAHAFCFLLSSLDDINVAVAQRACLYLTTLPNTGLRALCWCLEQQFDSVILDRPMIIQALHQLSSRLPDRRILTWEFFFNRFDALYLEAQIALEKYGDIAFPRDLKNSDMTSDVFERKLSRAKDALTLVQSASVRTLSASLGTKWPYKRTMSAPANMVNRAVEKQGDGGMRGCGVDDGSMVHQLQRAMDLEETDKDTLHLLVFLFMQFLSQPQHAGGSEDKSSVKMMNLVLRHLSVLMGFSPTERCFTISPSRLRSSPVFNAFLSNLCHVLDHNFNMGTLLLPTCLPVLQFCPAPHRNPDLRHPTFTLWSLQPHPRRYWFRAVLILLYKYKYSNQPLHHSQVVSLVRIVLNTLDAHCHRCRKVDDPTVCGASSAYSREVSQGSLGNEGEQLGGGESPPPSPGLHPGGGTAGGGRPAVFTTFTDPARTQYLTEHKSAFTPVSQDARGVTVLGQHKLGPAAADEARKHRKNNDISSAIEGDDVEPELEAIPESPKTDSPYCQESLTDLDPYPLVVQGEMATICVEGERGRLVTPCSISHPSATASATIVVPQTFRAQAVTSVMASQIQAFDESFTVKIHNAELLPLDHSALGGGERLLTRAPHPHYHQHHHNNSNNSNINSNSNSSNNNSDSSNSVVKALESRRAAAHHSSHLSPKSHPHHVQGEVFRPIDPPGYSITPDLSSSHERLLPIGMGTDKCGTPEAGCMKSGNNSVMTVAEHGRMAETAGGGSPVEVDESVGGAGDSPGISSPSEALELPTPERLLPVGGEKAVLTKKEEEGGPGGSILERVWQVFGGWTNGNSRMTSQSSDSELMEVVAHKETHKPLKLKVDSGSSHESGEQQDQTSTSLEDNTDTSHSATTTNTSATLQGY